MDLMDGQPTGSVRVSFGYMSTFEDCQKFLSFVAECFVEKPLTVDQVRLDELREATTACRGSIEYRPIKITNGELCKADEEENPSAASPRGFGQTETNTHGEAYTLTNIFIYPVKSCAAYEV